MLGIRNIASDIFFFHEESYTSILEMFIYNDFINLYHIEPDAFPKMHKCVKREKDRKRDREKYTERGFNGNYDFRYLRISLLILTQLEDFIKVSSYDNWIGLRYLKMKSQNS